MSFRRLLMQRANADIFVFIDFVKKVPNPNDYCYGGACGSCLMVNLRAEKLIPEKLSDKKACDNRLRFESFLG